MMRSVLEYLEASASHRPESIAVVDESGDHSYRELLEASRSAGSSLASEGIEGRPVMIVGEKGFSLLAAMFGVLFAGGYYVPVDPGMPADRMRSIFACLREPLVIADCDSASSCGEKLPESRVLLLESLFSDVANDELLEPIRSRRVDANPAYVLFTSGSTGEPKGVIGTHAAVLSYAADHAARVLHPAVAKAGRPLRVAHAWSFTFDAAWQPLAALLDGHGLHIVGDEVQRDAEALVATIGQYGIDLIDTTPSMFTQLQAEGLLTTVPLTALVGESPGVHPAADGGMRTVLLSVRHLPRVTVEVFRLEFPDGAEHISPSHGTGVREHLTVVDGKVLAVPTAKILKEYANRADSFWAEGSKHVTLALGSLAAAVIVGKEVGMGGKNAYPIGQALTFVAFCTGFGVAIAEQLLFWLVLKPHVLPLFSMTAASASLCVTMMICRCFLASERTGTSRRNTVSLSRFSSG